MAMAATCEIGGCGVVAIGRCRSCGRAFCGSHQAEYDGPFGVRLGASDLCRECVTAAARRKAELAESERDREISENNRLTASLLPRFLASMEEQGNPGTQKGVVGVRRDGGPFVPTGAVIDMWLLPHVRRGGDYHFIGTDGIVYHGQYRIVRVRTGKPRWLSPSEPAREVCPAQDFDVLMMTQDGTLAKSLERIPEQYGVW